MLTFFTICWTSFLISKWELSKQVKIAPCVSRMISYLFCNALGGSICFSLLLVCAYLKWGVSVKINVIAVHVGCHVQGLQHGFPSSIEFEYCYSTIIHINCSEPEPSKQCQSLLLKELEWPCSYCCSMIFCEQLQESWRQEFKPLAKILCRLHECDLLLNGPGIYIEIRSKLLKD